MVKNSIPTNGSVYIITGNDLPQFAESIANMIKPALAEVMSQCSMVGGGIGSDFVSPEEQYITKAQACNILGRCDSTLTKWCSSGKLIPVRRGGLLYYKLQDVLQVYRGEK